MAYDLMFYQFRNDASKITKEYCDFESIHHSQIRNLKIQSEFGISFEKNLFRICNKEQQSPSNNNEESWGQWNLRVETFRESVALSRNRRLTVSCPLVPAYLLHPESPTPNDSPKRVF